MKTLSKALGKKLLGARYEQAIRSIVIFAFLSFALSGMKTGLEISFHVVALMSFLFSFSLSLQTFSSDENAEYLKGQFMLPFTNSFVFIYAGAVTFYVIVTKSLLMLALLIGLTQFGLLELLCFLVSAVNACVTGAVLFALAKKQKVASVAVLCLQVVFCFSGLFSIPLYFGAALLMTALLLVALGQMDQYLFMKNVTSKAAAVRTNRSGWLVTVWAYVARYFTDHQGYIANTLFLWAFGCVFAGIIGTMGTVLLLPLGLSVLSINTVFGVVISTNRSLHKKLSMLPGQVRQFVVPLGILVLLNTLLAYAVYYLAWNLLNGAVPWAMYLLGGIYAAEAAVITVFVEWRYPLLHWKVESDILHHPRKYIAPAILMVETMLILLVFSG